MRSLSTLRPFSLGFDDLFKLADAALDETHQSYTAKFPPCNLIKVGNYEFVIELALAGYSKNDISITTQNNTLTISSAGFNHKDTFPNSEFLYHGISAKGFEKSFTLSDSMVIKNASFINGLLTINLEKIVPEEKKPRTISIS